MPHASVTSRHVRMPPACLACARMFVLVPVASYPPHTAPCTPSMYQFLFTTFTAMDDVPLCLFASNIEMCVMCCRPTSTTTSCTCPSPCWGWPSQKGRRMMMMAHSPPKARYTFVLLALCVLPGLVMRHACSTHQLPASAHGPPTCYGSLYCTCTTSRQVHGRCYHSAHSLRMLWPSLHTWQATLGVRAGGSFTSYPTVHMHHELYRNAAPAISMHTSVNPDAHVNRRLLPASRVLRPPGHSHAQELTAPHVPAPHVSRVHGGAHGGALHLLFGRPIC